MRIPDLRRRSGDGGDNPRRGSRLPGLRRWTLVAVVPALVVVGIVLGSGGPSPRAGGVAGFLSSAEASGSPAPGGSPSGDATPTEEESAAVSSSPSTAASPTPVPTPRPTPRPTARPTQPPPPPVNGTFAWGMWAGQPWNTGSIQAAVNLVGHKPAILLTYQHWDRRAEFLDDDARAIKAFGAAWMVTWEPDASLQSIGAGSSDAFITGWAKAAAAWGGTIYLRYMHEMNGDWYPWGVYNGHNGNSPADFVKAWRHTHDLFVAAGATNVNWVWSQNVRYGSNYPFADLYPGPSYVDWIALDGYNWGGQVGGHPGWQSMASIFLNTYNQVLAYGKPIVIAETASAEGGGDKAAWIRTSFFTDVPQKMPRIRGVIWFNENAETDFRINSSAASLAAFQQMAASSAWKGRIP